MLAKPVGPPHTRPFQYACKSTFDLDLCTLFLSVLSRDRGQGTPLSDFPSSCSIVGPSPHPLPPAPSSTPFVLELLPGLGRLAVLLSTFVHPNRVLAVDSGQGLTQHKVILASPGSHSLPACPVTFTPKQPFPLFYAFAPVFWHFPCFLITSACSAQFNVDWSTDNRRLVRRSEWAFSGSEILWRSSIANRAQPRSNSYDARHVASTTSDLSIRLIPNEPKRVCSNSPSISSPTTRILESTARHTSPTPP